jgi:hypothetical protein
MPTLKAHWCCPARVSAGRGEDVPEDATAAISPYLTERFNRFGDDTFNLGGKTPQPDYAYTLKRAASGSLNLKWPILYRSLPHPQDGYGLGRCEADEASCSHRLPAKSATTRSFSAGGCDISRSANAGSECSNRPVTVDLSSLSMAATAASCSSFRPHPVSLALIRQAEDR